MKNKIKIKCGVCGWINYVAWYYNDDTGDLRLFCMSCDNVGSILVKDKSISKNMMDGWDELINDFNENTSQRTIFIEHVPFKKRILLVSPKNIFINATQEEKDYFEELSLYDFKSHYSRKILA